MTRNQIVIALVAVAILAIGAVVYFYAFSGTPVDAVPPGGTASGNNYTITSDDHTMGSPKAPIVMIEYAAPTCPHCAHFNEVMFPVLKEKYIDTGKVFYVFRVYPLHPSDGAVEAMSKCMPADKYFEFIDLMFRNQPKWDWEYGVTDIHAGLVQMGRIAGLSADQVDKCIADTTVQEHINKVAQDGQTRYSITGTPTFVINGGVHSAADIGTPEDMASFFNGILSKK